MFKNRRLMPIIFCLLVSGFLSLYLQSRGAGADRAATIPRLPIEEQGWRGEPFTTFLPSDIKEGDYILRKYTKNGREVDFLALHSRIANYHPPSLCYEGTGRQLTELPSIVSSSGRIRLAGILGRSGLNSILIYHGFFINGKVIPDGIEKKIYEVKEKLILGYINQYFLEVTILVHEKNQEQSIYFVKSFLDDMERYLIQPESLENQAPIPTDLIGRDAKKTK